MQMLIDFLPLVIALVAYKMAGIYAATIALMVTLPLIPLGQKLLGRKVSQVHLWSAVLVLVFGSATLVLRDPRFIMWKPTVLYVAMAIGLVAMERFTERTVLERAMGSAIVMRSEHWRTLNGVWAAFFVFLGALNLYVVYNFTEAAWINFKVWGLTGLTLVFVVGQSIWISPRIIEQQDDAASEDD